MYKAALTILALIFFCINASAQSTTSFKVVPLGVKGGLDESNLSAYMIGDAASNSYVCVDAGTVRFGIEKAIANKVFKVSSAVVLRNYIKGYLISHAHLDHVAGLIINSPDDTAKNIYALPAVTDVLRDKYFTWQSWANFANEGDKPALNKYHYIRLNEAADTLIANTGLHVKAFSLSHSAPYESTAFLIENKGNYILYLGDTGADEVEKSHKLHDLWQYIAPLITSHHLKSIFIEVSFPNAQPDNQLFGHLTPNRFMKEMEVLGTFTGKAALAGFSVAITHIKPTGNNERIIKEQLAKQNKLKLQLIFPKQGVALKF